MEYKGIVQTVVETPTYLAIANNLFSEGERANIVALVAAHPGMWGCDAGNGWIPKTSGRPQRHGKERRCSRRVYLAQ